MEKLKYFLFSLVLFIGLTGTGTAIGYSIGTNQAELHGEGRFSKWVMISRSYTFEKIIDATPEIIWAQSSDGRLFSYFYRCNSQPDCGRWIQIKEVPENAHEFYDKPEISISCASSDLKYFTSPPGNIKECTRVRSSGLDVFVPTTINYFALADNGELWSWGFSYSPIDAVFYILSRSIIGLLVGFAIFSFIIVLYAAYRRKKSPKPIV